jgi:hypothetical protein
MATRLYINRDYYHYLDPTPDAGWERTTGHLTYKINTVKRTSSPHSSLLNTALTAQGTSGNDTLLGQFLTDPLDVNQTITGNFKGQARFLESAAGLDARSQVLIWVVKPDGTSRGTLLAMSAAALASEFGTALANRRIPVGGSVALGSVAALAGDRIVIEVGARQHATLGGTFQMSMGYAATDLAEDDTTTTANAPWFEFSQNITFTAEATMMASRTALTVLVQGDARMRVSRTALTVLVQDPVQPSGTQVIMIG